LDFELIAGMIVQPFPVEFSLMAHTNKAGASGFLSRLQLERVRDILRVQSPALRACLTRVAQPNKVVYCMSLRHQKPKN
jgi:hypothetical protein